MSCLQPCSRGACKLQVGSVCGGWACSGKRQRHLSCRDIRGGGQGVPGSMLKTWAVFWPLRARTCVRACM
eukprot:240341-Chlamydomonas_euryale.AAC.23